MEILPTAQGIFYPETKEEIIRLFKYFETPQKLTAARLVIVPHAGYEYCGRLALDAYGCMTENTKNVIVIAPAIYNRIYGSITCSADAFITPLGKLRNIPANGLEINNKVFVYEHALTVQLVFIKYFHPKAAVTPIIYGCENYRNITKLIKENIKKSLIVIVSNLSRLVPERELIRQDEQTARMIERKEIRDLDVELADGAVGICGAIEFAKQNSYEFVKIGLTNSSKINKDTSNAVGYGSWGMVTQ